MKSILALIAVAFFTSLISDIKLSYQQPPNPQASVRASESLSNGRTLKTKAKPSQPAKRKADKPERSDKPLSCRQAISQVFPPSLKRQAQVVLENENSSEYARAIGEKNWDGSRDFGCFQINNKAHPDFFKVKDWRDPLSNARYAYQVYQERKAEDNIGWTAWYAVEGILW